MILAIGVVGYGLALVLNPAAFVDEPPFARYDIRSAAQAVALGGLVLVLTGVVFPAAYRKARARPPAVELTPEGLTISVSEPPIHSLPWREVEGARVEWERPTKFLAVTTVSGTIRVQHDQVATDLERISRAINEYRGAHAPGAS